MNYADFLARKKLSDPATGIVDADPTLPTETKPHQADIARWALRRGRAAVFAGTGLGKTLIELLWADTVSRHMRKPVLIVAPLAVSAQHIREGERFGVAISHARIAHNIGASGVYVTNYGKLPHFDLSKFSGITLDESSILKAHDGKTRTRLIEDCARIPFRLAATATPAPNDFMELGNHAEFLGIMSYVEMLATFFVHDGGSTQKWRLKGHAHDQFWRWLASWAVALRHPRDLGYDDAGYDLPQLIRTQHIVPVEYRPDIETGTLFPMEARSMQERIASRRSSIDQRVATAASIVATKPDVPWVVWCNLNAESDALAKAIPGAVEIRGNDDEAEKERRLVRFAEGGIRVIVTKPSITGYGLNWQHCRDTVFVGLNDSFEQLYQATRRFWRFGQTETVNAHYIASELEGAVVANLARKEADAEEMSAQMVAHMADINSAALRGSHREKADYEIRRLRLPTFLEDA